MKNEQLHEALGHSASICKALSEIYTQWCVRGPSLEASTAIAAMSQEQAGYSRMLDRLAEGMTPEACPLPSLLASPASWPELVGIAGTVELALAAALSQWRTSVDDSAIRNLTKMAQELGYHARFFRGWFQVFDDDISQASVMFNHARATTELEVWSWLSTLSIRTGTSLDGATGASDNEQLASGAASSPQICPRCGAENARMISTFGPSLMTSQFRCGACNGFFEAVRWSLSESSVQPSDTEVADQGPLRP